MVENETQTAPVAAVIETPAVTPTTVETPVTTTVEAPVTEVKVETPTVETKPVTTILGDAMATEEITSAVEPPKESETKSEETPKTTDEKKEGQSDEPAPPPKPVFDEFKIPEELQVDKERVKQFTDILSEFEKGTKAEHAKVQEFGQKAVDFHIQELQKSITDLSKFYQKAWEDQKIKWKEQFLSDPDIGGNRFQTTLDSALNFIRTHGGTPEQQKEFRAVMETSGLGNHPAIIRLLASAGRAMSEGKPLAATNPVPVPKSKVETLYGKNK